MRKKKSAGLSDSTMQRLWVKTVRARYNNCCGICGKYNTGTHECHHVIKRRAVLTRHDWRNGILLCQECHRKMDLPGGELLVAQAHHSWDYLMAILPDAKNASNYFQKIGITKYDWFNRQKKDMLEKIPQFERGEY